MLPRGDVAVFLLVITAAWLAGWIVVTRWESTDQTAARRRELEAERLARGSGAARPLAWPAWELAARTTLFLVPVLFVADGLGAPIGLLYAPALTYAGPVALPLQVLGVACALIALVILFWVGRILAVKVYRKAADERELLQTGLFAYIRHPFYLHFLLLPVGLVLLTLNPLMLLVVLAYLTLDGPVLPSTWMRDEERELTERHGATYVAYMERTGRWLPRLRGRAAVVLIVAIVILAIALVAALATRPAPPAASAAPGSASVPPQSAAVPSLAPVPPVEPWAALTWRLVGSREVTFSAGSSTFVIDAAAWRGGVVAVGYDVDPGRIVGRLFRSADGSDWREVASPGGPPFHRMSFDRILALGERLVIVGRDRTAELRGDPNDPGRPVAFESTDGETWAPVADGPWLRPSIWAAAQGRGTVLALEDGGGVRTLWRSTDGGTSWTSTPLEATFPGGEVHTMAWAGERWLAGGAVGAPPADRLRPGWGAAAVWTSPDGVAWEAAQVQLPGHSIDAILVGQDGLVATSSMTGRHPLALSTRLWRSVDGAAWEELHFENRFLSLVADGRRVVALDRRDDERLRVRESFDGVDWRDVDVLVMGRTNPAEPALVDGWTFPGQVQRLVLLPGGIWALGREHVSSVDGVSETEAELRWFASPGRAPGAVPMPPGTVSGSNDAP